MDNRELINLALKARKNSYSPYSGFRVGAALLTKSGKVYTGCNIENAAFGPTVCAERTAVFKAVSEGERKFLKIAVAGGKDEIPDSYAYPCGVCRQVLAEFCGADFEIISAVSPEDYVSRTLAGMLPDSFGPDNLG
ncbi:MAG: cytidine deaminase [Clostridia bacterium]|nr:cytidine deaminase [Clostridia bacterium]